MSNIQLTVEQLAKLQLTDIIGYEPVKQRFIQVYDTLWGEGKGEAAYERESIFFNRHLSDNIDRYRGKVTPFSVFTTFIDLAVCGLSVEPGVRALCYLQPRSTKIGKDSQGRDVYEGRLTLTISGYGELVLRARCGQIKYADNPVLVYEEDSFQFSDNDGRKSVSYTCNLPHKSGHVIACFIRITRTDGSIDYSVMFEEDWQRLSGFSAKQNRYYDQNSRQWIEKPNQLYTSGLNGTIDTGFLQAKCIKHAFKTYPKVRIGKATMLETEDEIQHEDDFYVMTEGEKPAMPKPETFCPPSDTSHGVTVEEDPNNDDPF